MNFKKLTIEASTKIVEPGGKAKAELLSALLLCRLVAVIGLTCVFAFTHNPTFQLLVGVSIVNFIAYLVARTKQFKVGVYIAVLEPLIAIPHSAFIDPNNLNATIGGGMWLGLGTLMASLILPIRQTIVFIVATCGVFGILIVKVDPQYLALTLSESLAVLGISCLALVGTYLRDESDRQLQIERAKVLQSSKLASLGEMASGVAHELNSPLGAIVLTTEMLEDILASLDSNQPESLKEAIEEVRAIGSIAERMGKIISGLKTFARDADNEALIEVEVKTWVQDSLDLCRQRFHNAGVHVDVASANLDTVCAVQAIQISQTLVNLLNNSFDAIQDKQEKWIRIDALIKDSNFELRVTDSGFGIPKEQAEKIFDPFYTTKDYSHGTGLGLSISKGIAQAHGGDLSYDRTSTNTRFILRLPLATPALRAVKAAA